MLVSDLPAVVESVWPALRADAARRAGVAPEQLRVASVQAVVWPDGALGCPQPGRMYTQALVPGHRVSVAHEASGRHWTYHTSERGGWLWCAPENAQPSLPRSADPRM